MLQQSFRLHVLRQRESPRPTRGTDKKGHPLAVKIIQPRIVADRGVEWAPTE